MIGPHSRCGQLLRVECQGDPRPPEVSMAPWLEVVMPWDQEAAMPMFCHCQLFVASPLWVRLGALSCVPSWPGLTDHKYAECRLRPRIMFPAPAPPFRPLARAHHSAFYSSAQSYITYIWSCKKHSFHNIVSGLENYWSNWTQTYLFKISCVLTFDSCLACLACWPDKCLAGSVERGRGPMPHTRNPHRGGEPGYNTLAPREVGCCILGPVCDPLHKYTHTHISLITRLHPKACVQIHMFGSKSNCQLKMLCWCWKYTQMAGKLGTQ